MHDRGAHLPPHGVTHALAVGHRVGAADDGRAIGARAVDFDARGAARDDGVACAGGFAAGVRDGEGVVAGGVRDYDGGAGVEQCVKGAADLEGARELQGLGFEEDAGAGGRREKRRGGDVRQDCFVGAVD